MDVTICSGSGNVFSVPEQLATTESQLRWLTQTEFSGCASEPTITIDTWARYESYQGSVVYRTTLEFLHDFIGRQFYIYKYGRSNRFQKWFWNLCLPFLSFSQLRAIQRWGEIVGALHGKKLVWRFR